LEPPAKSLGNSCSIHLSYTPRPGDLSKIGGFLTRAVVAKARSARGDLEGERSPQTFPVGVGVGLSGPHVHGFHQPDTRLCQLEDDTALPVRAGRELRQGFVTVHC